MPEPLTAATVAAQPAEPADASPTIASSPESSKQSGPSTRPVSQESVARSISGAVLSVSGVVRLQPTLISAGLKILPWQSPVDGIHIRSRAGTIETDIFIASDSGHQARTVARAVHRRVTDELRKLGHPGIVTVNVLTIDDMDDPAPAAGTDV